MNGPPSYIASANLPLYNCQIPWQNQWDNYIGSPFLAPRGSQTSSSLSGPRFQPPPCGQASAEVQQYLDTNANESFRNYDKADKDISQLRSQWYCHTCKIWFRNNSSLNAHLKTSKAHKKAGKLQNTLDTPEQIAKWREERKRNYPTLSNIVKKQEDEKLQNESGQTLQSKQFRYNQRQGWKQGKRGSKKEDTKGSRKFKQSYPESRESQHSNKTKLLENDTKETVTNSGALAALAAVYGVSSSDEGDQCDNNKEQSQTDHIEKEPEPCPKQESKKAKLNESNVNNVEKIVKKKSYPYRVKRKRGQCILQNHKRPSLLEMLLAPDIRHERNVILQCLRYVVKKDFFRIGSQDNGNIS